MAGHLKSSSFAPHRAERVAACNGPHARWFVSPSTMRRRAGVGGELAAPPCAWREAGRLHTRLPGMDRRRGAPEGRAHLGASRPARPQSAGAPFDFIVQLYNESKTSTTPPPSALMLVSAEAQW